MSRSLKETQRNISMKLRRKNVRKDKCLSDAHEDTNISSIEIVTVQDFRTGLNEERKTVKRTQTEMKINLNDGT